MAAPVLLSARWTMGDVAPRGFEALHLSLWGAWRLFGSAARYTVVVNTIAPSAVASRVLAPPAGVAWRAAPPIPPRLARWLDAGMAQGVGWKLVPEVAHADVPELALDNDVILWRRPGALERWLRDPASFLLAADAQPCFGRFALSCGDRPLNAGVRGTPAGWNLCAALQDMLARHPGRLTSEVDEQGLQVATLVRQHPLHVIDTQDVAICSPFPPHSSRPGRSGAHFVGVNSRHLGWRAGARPAEEIRAEHWDRSRAALYELTGAPPLPEAPG